MLTNDSISFLLGRLNLILHSLDLPLHLMKLLCSLLKGLLERLDLPLELFNLFLEVRLLLLLLPENFFVAPLYLLDILNVVLLLLSELAIKVAVKLSNELLMLFLKLLDLFSMLCLQSVELSRRGSAHVGPQLSDFFLVSIVEGFDLLCVLKIDLRDRISVVSLQLFNSLLKLSDHFALLIHEFLFVLSMLCLQPLNLSLKLRNALFELHLDELFVAAGVFAKLVEHLLILVLLLL